MAKRVAPRRAHGERSHQVDNDENIIPIDHETAEIIAFAMRDAVPQYAKRRNACALRE